MSEAYDFIISYSYISYRISIHFKYALSRPFEKLTLWKNILIGE